MKRSGEGNDGKAGHPFVGLPRRDPCVGWWSALSIVPLTRSSSIPKWQLRPTLLCT